MASFQQVLFSFPDNPTFFQTASDAYNFDSRLEDHMSGMAGGAKSGSVQCTSINNDAVAAHGTFTFSAAASASDTVLINGVTFTGEASGATGNQFNVGVSATQTATNLAAAINGSATALVSGTVKATPALGVVTITAKTTGPSGNAITIAKGVDAGSVNTVSGARLTGGTADTGSQATATYHYGY